MPVLTPPPRASAEAATARLVDGLQRRLQAEHPGGAVRRIETHISWLLLAGPHAYKLKKPLTLDFLDFGTPEQRRAACEEELRINRRSAPDLYLQVLPVTGTPDAPRLGGDARGAIDWAVHMRRFPDDALLSERAARGQLGPEPIDALAREVAAFQAQAAVAAANSPGAARTSWRSGRRTTSPPGRPAGRHRAGRDATTSEAMDAGGIRATGPLMAQRRAAGRVREGHGDLHLGNLLWLDGRARLFDAIEFNPQLRWIDTACDIAFVFMDLHAHGLAPLAWRFLNRWLECSGDFGAVARLPWDASYRALVRAKVAALRAGQAAAPRPWPTRSATCAWPPGWPRRAALAGADHGRQRLGQEQPDAGPDRAARLVRLRADVERKRLFGLAPEASSAGVPGGIYGEDASERVFAHLLGVARTLLQAGQPVLVDATFIRRARRPFIALAQALDMPWRILAFDAPEPVLRERVRQRHAGGGDASEADLAVLQDRWPSASLC
jgi:aminoglycoside phosphotransferase family enzyme/predicted kinase